MSRPIMNTSETQTLLLSAVVSQYTPAPKNLQSPIFYYVMMCIADYRMLVSRDGRSYWRDPAMNIHNQLQNVNRARRK